MTDLTTVAAYIEWQEERALDGKTATLEEYREHLATGQARATLEEALTTAYNHDHLVKLWSEIKNPTEFEGRAMNIIVGLRECITDALESLATEPTKEIDL